VTSRGFTDRFLRLGDRLFSRDSCHRVPYQPVLYFFTFGAAFRMMVTEDRGADIHSLTILSAWTDEMWLILSLVSPPLAALAWWLVVKCKWRKAPLAGLWVRLGADLGQFIALLTFHLVTLNAAVMSNSDVQIYFRYITGATVIFVLFLIFRDIWAIAATERIAGALRHVK
jgi:hypothetical protein